MMKKILPILLVLFLVVAFGFMHQEKFESTVSVTASASIEIEPDIAYLRISSEAIEDSTEKAREEMNRIVNQAVAILESEYSVLDEDIETEYISFNPYYEWIDNTRVSRGYRASQSLTVTIHDIDSIGRIIDSLSLVDGVSVSSMEFDRKDISRFEDEVRALAVKEAHRKASKYAEGAGLNVGRILSISDGSSYSQAKYANTMVYATEATSASGSTSYYEGKVTVSDRVSVIYVLED